MKKSFTLIYITITLLFIMGCASILQKPIDTQEIIQQPINFCKRVEAKQDVIPQYDDSMCYPFKKKVLGMFIKEMINGSTFQGYLSTEKGRWDSITYQFQMPMQIYEKDRYTGYGYIKPHIYSLEDSLCIRHHNGALSKETAIKLRSYGNTRVPVLEVIKKKKLSNNERQKRLKSLQQIIDTKYNTCQAEYNNLFAKWNTESDGKTFCEYVQKQWIAKSCGVWNIECDGVTSYEEAVKKGCKRISDECINWVSPFVECYTKKQIKVNPAYMALFN